MPRRPRICPAGVCFHVLNRAVARLPLFEKAEDCKAFERVLEESFERHPLLIYAYSAWRNVHGDQASRALLARWPIPRPRQWRSFVNKPQTEAEVDSIRRSLLRGTLYGSERWITQSATRLELEHTLRSRGRPRKK